MAFSLHFDITQGTEAKPIKCDDSAASAVQLQHCFKYVKTNVPGPGFSKDKFSEQFAGCACSGACYSSVCSCLQLFGSAYDESGKIKIDCFQDLPSKPVLECGRSCSCNPELCANRVVQRGITRTFCIFQTKDRGYGLMLDRNESEVSERSFVCEYAGEVVGNSEARRRMKETDAAARENYLIAVREHVSEWESCVYIDPCNIGNVGRFINHSCDPNLIMVPVRVNHQIPRLALFARKNIKPGEEFTFDYSGMTTLNISPDPVTEPDSNKPSHIFTCHSKNEIQNTNYDINSPGTQNVGDSSTKTEHFSESEIDPSKKRRKSSEIDLSKKRRKSSQASNNSDLDLCTSETESVRQNVAKNNNHRDAAKKEEATRLKKATLETVATRDLLDTKYGHGEIPSTPDIKRKPCFCGSHICTGFLPLDRWLVFD